MYPSWAPSLLFVLCREFVVRMLRCCRVLQDGTRFGEPSIEFGQSWAAPSWLTFNMVLSLRPSLPTYPIWSMPELPRALCYLAGSS